MRSAVPSNDERGSSTHEMEKDSEPVHRSLISWNYFFGTIWYIILCVRIRSRLRQFFPFVNPSVPDAPNWRISVLKKRLHETETS